MIRKIEEIRLALQTAGTVYNAFRQAAKPGATELALESAVLAAAGEHETNFDLITGPRTAGIEGGATERVLSAGDPLLLDLCLKQGDHWCDVCRTYFLGTPDEEIVQTYEKVLECYRSVASLLRPGAPASGLYRTVETYFAQNGMAGMLRHHTGHAIGLTPFEPPVETADSRDELRAGDVMTVEIGAYREGRYGIRLEDDFLVTERGAAPLWDYPIGLQNAILPNPSTKEMDHQ